MSRPSKRKKKPPDKQIDLFLLSQPLDYEEWLAKGKPFLCVVLKYCELFEDSCTFNVDCACRSVHTRTNTCAQAHINACAVHIIGKNP